MDAATTGKRSMRAVTKADMTKEPKPMQARPVPINWHSGLSIYASEAFLKTAGDDYGWLGGFDGSGNIRCVLPYSVMRKAIFKMVRFRVEVIPLVDGFTIEDEKSFLTAVVSHFRAAGADMIIPATASTIFRAYPDGADAAPYGTFRIDLTLPEETLWANIHQKHRNVIRNAMKSGVQVRSGMEYLDAAYGMVRETLKRSGLGFQSRDSFMRLVSDLRENVKVFVAEHQGVIQGCAVIPFSGHGAYYVYGGSAPETATGAMNLLHWEAIRQLRERGVRSYDFVGARINPEPGSKQEGLKRFKERFGGQFVQGYMWKYSFQPIKYFLYGTGVRLLHGGDIVDQERHNLPADASLEKTAQLQAGLEAQ
jgi:hypothetical protein